MNKLKRIFSVAKTICLVFVASAMMTSFSGLAISNGTIIQKQTTLPDGIILTETAEAVDWQRGLWDITLRVDAPTAVKNIDTVIVLDTSGSISTPEFSKMRKASLSLMRTILDTNPNNQIAVVTFNTEVMMRHNLSNDITSLANYLNATSSPIGNSFMQGGIIVADEILKFSPNWQKNIVVFTDGEPHCAVKPNNSSYFGTMSSIIQNNVTARVLGSCMTAGQLIDARSGTINAANTFKNASLNNTVHVISREVTTPIENFIKQVASENSSYSVLSYNNLGAVFQEIADKIVLQNISFETKDLLNRGITISSQSVVGVAGENSLNWIPNLKYDDGLFNGAGGYYDEITYRVEIGDKILETTPDENGDYQLHEQITITYNNKTANFPPLAIPVYMPEPLIKAPNAGRE